MSLSSTLSVEYTISRTRYIRNSDERHGYDSWRDEVKRLLRCCPFAMSTTVTSGVARMQSPRPKIIGDRDCTSPVTQTKHIYMCVRKALLHLPTEHPAV